MFRDPLIVAARTLAALWYMGQQPRTQVSKAYAWAQENFVMFLLDATEPMGKAIMGVEMTPAEREQAAADMARVRARYGYGKRQPAAPEAGEFPG